MDKDAVLKILNRIMELELSGVVRYTHYALMVYGYNRIPIVDWLQKQAEEGLVHARQAGELVTWLGGHPSLGHRPSAGNTHPRYRRHYARIAGARGRGTAGLLRIACSR